MKSNSKENRQKNTEQVKMKNQVFRFTQIRIEQNNDHAWMMHKTQFRRSFNGIFKLIKLLNYQNDKYF